jgi:hypothetical protein
VGSFAFDSGDSALTFGSAIAVADPSATDPRDVTYRILASTEYGLDCTHVDTSFPDWPVARPTAGIDGHPVMVVELGTYSAWVGAGVSATASCNGERCSLANWGAADIYNPGLFYDTSCLFDPARSELGDATSVWVQCFVSGLSTPPARFEIRATVCR